jgi:hypothetical protein
MSSSQRRGRSIRRHSRSRPRTEGKVIMFFSSLTWVGENWIVICRSVFWLFPSFLTCGRISTQMPKPCDISWFSVGIAKVNLRLALRYLANQRRGHYTLVKNFALDIVVFQTTWFYTTIKLQFLFPRAVRIRNFSQLFLPVPKFPICVHS